MSTIELQISSISVVICLLCSLLLSSISISTNLISTVTVMRFFDNFFRRNSEKDYHSPKKSKNDIQHGEFLRSRSLDEANRKHKSQTKRPPIASDVKGHDIRWQENGSKIERRHAGDKRKLDSARKDTEKPQINKCNAQNLPFLNNGKHTEFQMKIPKIKDREQNMDSTREETEKPENIESNAQNLPFYKNRKHTEVQKKIPKIKDGEHDMDSIKKDAEKPQNNRINAQNMPFPNNGKHTEDPVNNHKVRDREQNLEQQNFLRKYDNSQSRMNDFRLIGPQFMPRLRPNVPTINGARPFLPNAPFYHGNGIQVSTITMLRNKYTLSY